MFNVWYLDNGKWTLGGRFGRMIGALRYIWRVRENNPSIRIKVKS